MPAESKCTPANVAAIVAALADPERPTPLRDALRAARVGHSAYYDWRRRAELDEPPYADAVHAIEQARAAHLDRWTRELALIAFAGTKEDATRLAALKFLLEKLGGEAWNPPTKTEVSGPQGAPIPVQHGGDEAILAVLSALAGPRGAGEPGGGAGGAAGGADP